MKTGDQLFSYDTEQLQLNLDKQKLEQEQLEATIENYKDQISELENQRANAGSSQQLAYTVQIQTMQVDLKEAELNLEAKKTDVASPSAAGKRWSRLPWTARFRPSMKVPPTRMAGSSLTLPSSRPVPSGSRGPWANCSGAASPWVPG